MALFDKRSPIDKLWDQFAKLSDEEKSKFIAKMQDIDKAEDEREVDKIEEDKAEDTELKDEKKEEVQEESEEIGKDVDETKELGGGDVEDVKGEEEEKEEDKAEDVKEEDRSEDILMGIDARLKAIEDIVLRKEKETTSDEMGVSGYGKVEPRGMGDDTRKEDIIKKLGGRA